MSGGRRLKAGHGGGLPNEFCDSAHDRPYWNCSMNEYTGSNVQVGPSSRQGTQLQGLQRMCTISLCSLHARSGTGHRGQSTQLRAPFRSGNAAASSHAEYHAMNKFTPSSHLRKRATWWGQTLLLPGFMALVNVEAPPGSGSMNTSGHPVACTVSRMLIACWSTCKI